MGATRYDTPIRRKFGKNTHKTAMTELEVLCPTQHGFRVEVSVLSSSFVKGSLYMFV